MYTLDTIQDCHFINSPPGMPMDYDCLIFNLTSRHPGVNYQALYLDKTVLTGTSSEC